MSINAPSIEGVSTDFVAGRITQIGRIGIGQVTTRTGRALIRTTGGEAGGVEGINLGGAGGGKSERHAVAGRGFAIARGKNQECRLVLAIQYDAIAERAEIFDAKRR